MDDERQVPEKRHVSGELLYLEVEKREELRQAQIEEWEALLHREAA